jgi:long-chain acyl-CoA synthetase
MAAFGNLVELAEDSVARFAERPLFGEHLSTGWSWQTYRRWQSRVDSIRAVLAGHGIVAGDRVAIVSRNSAVWAAAAYATFGRGAAFVPMYEQQRLDDWEYILRDSGARIVLVRTQQIASLIDTLQPRLPALRHILTIEDPIGLPVLESRASAVPTIHPASDDVAGIIYTSGTTAPSKGVMLTHGNITSNVLATSRVLPVSSHDRMLSFLPWAHIYGQVAELHSMIAAGASTAFNTATDRLLEDLRTVQPTILVAVPRVLERLYVTVRAELVHHPRVVRSVFYRGVDAAKRRYHGERLRLRDRVILWLAGFLFAVVRRKLGSHLRYAISGSAALGGDVAEALQAMGIVVYEGYGLTETSPIVSVNRPGHRKLGSVGLPIDDVRIELDRSCGDGEGEGEIIVHGPNVMKGYTHPEQTALAFADDGGLRTGDLGRLDGDGFLYLTGRLRDQYKLETGKYVMPAPLEDRLAMSPYIANVMLYGAGRPYTVALIALDTPAIRTWALENGLDLSTELTSDLRVRRLILGEIERYGGHFRPHERPVEIVLTQAPFSIENGLLTPTFKLKRREVTRRFGGALDAVYQRLRTEPHVLVSPSVSQLPLQQ